MPRTGRTCLRKLRRGTQHWIGAPEWHAAGLASSGRLSRQLLQSISSVEASSKAATPATAGSMSCGTRRATSAMNLLPGAINFTASMKWRLFWLSRVEVFPLDLE